ncbi:MAG: hypothetical protein ABSH25_06695 [Syntrophorhabdales bacterium]
MAAVDGVLKGEVDMAGPTEFVVVEKILQKQPIGILGSTNRSMTMHVVGWKNRESRRSPISWENGSALRRER